MKIVFNCLTFTETGMWKFHKTFPFYKIDRCFATTGNNTAISQKFRKT